MRTFETHVNHFRNGWIDRRDLLVEAAYFLKRDLGPDLQLFRSIQAALRTAKVSPDCVLFNIAIKQCIDANNLPGALALLDEMRQGEVVPDLVTFNTVMSGYAKKADWTGIRQLLGAMRAMDPPLQPNKVTFGVMMDAYATEENGEAAEALLRELLRRAERDPALVPDIQTWGVAIHAHAASGKGAAAEGLFREACLQHPSAAADVMLRCLVLKGYAKDGDGRNAERVLRAVPPHARSLGEYNTAIGAYATDANPDAARRLFRDMRSQEPPIRPDRITWTHRMTACVRAADADAAEEVLADIARLPYHDGDDDLLAMLWHEAMLIHADAGRPEEAEALLRRMANRRPAVAPGIEHYDTLVGTFHQAKRHADASRLIREAIAARVFDPSLGYSRREDELDFHVSAIAHHRHAEGKGVSARFAVALLHYHRVERNLTSRTQFAVGSHGTGRLKDAILGELKRQGRTYQVSPSNPGRLVPAD